MHHLIWISSGVESDLRSSLTPLLRLQGIQIADGLPHRSPDLAIASWEQREDVLRQLRRDEWTSSPPVAMVYLAADRLHAVLAQQLTDPLADAVLMPARATDLAFAIGRALSRRDYYLNIGPVLLTDRVDESRHGLVGASPALRLVIEVAHQVAESPNTNVLIAGESGTGKELLAQLIHARTPSRRHRPFVDVNCAAIPSELLESELFGFERGAFTNAGRNKAGLMEVAHGGTLFLDEIGELNIGLQAKLLRVLESGAFRRLGGITDRRSDCRVIASTNRNLLDAVQHGFFRLDLYHRLAVLTLRTPPLRERREDILPLAEHFLRALAPMMKRRVTGFSPTAQALLVGYPYPGNVRELKNIIERALIVSAGSVIAPKDLGLDLTIMVDIGAGQAPALVGGLATASSKPLAEQSLGDREREHIGRVLLSTSGNRTIAARLLGISIPTLYNKIRKYGFEDVGRRLETNS